MTERAFEDKLRQVKKGFHLWHEIIEKVGLHKEDYILVFPHCNHVINEVGLKYLNLFTKIRRPHKIMILFQSEKLYQEIVMESTTTPLLAKRLSESEMDDLLSCYSAVNLSAHFIVMSLTEPFGRCGEKVIERKGVNIDQVVLFGIYGFSFEDVKNEV